MIAHVGDTSNLILDPDLDSYYTMDATLIALPQTQDRISNIVAFAQELAARGRATDDERCRLTVMAAFLKESDLARVQADADLALNEDTNFQGVSAVTAEEPSAGRDELRARDERADRRAGGVGPGRHRFRRHRDGRDQRPAQASFAVWRVAVDELDVLLRARLDASRIRARSGPSASACWRGWPRNWSSS